MRLFRLIGVAGLATGAVLAAADGPRAETDEQSPVSVFVYESVAEPYSETLILRGRTEADRHVEVKAELAGIVVSEPLDKGARVREGDLLCELDEAERPAALAEAKAKLVEAELVSDAAQSLSKKGFTSETRAKSMTAQLEQARAEVARATLNMNRLRIVAPFNGILETDTAEKGSLLQGGSICASMIALNPIQLIAYAPERSVDQLKVGAPVSARLITGREIDGKISFVARSADRDTRTYLVEAEAPNPDSSIRDGMTAEIRVQLESRLAHRIPQTALTLDDEGAMGVRIAEDGVARFVPVEMLRDEPEGVWVTGPPKEARIIVVGQEFVSDGRKVEARVADPELIR